MKKNTRLTFRVQSQLKETLEAIAAKEGRSVAQVCEAFLKAGINEFKRTGSRYLQQLLTRSKPETS